MQSRTIRYTGAISLAVLLLSSPATAQRWNDLEDALEGRELVMRPTTEGRRKLYLDVEGGDAFVLHRGDRLFPLREREPILIVDADPEDDHIELELQSGRLGRGRVDFHGPAPAADEFERWLDEVFEIATPEADFHRYVGNQQSGTLHEVFHGVRRNGALVATLRFDVQRLFRRELDVIATLSTTAELGDEDNVNTLDIRVGGRRIRLRERTAERIFPSDEVSAVFGNDEARGLIDGSIEAVELDLGNVDRWVRSTVGGAP